MFMQAVELDVIAHPCHHATLENASKNTRLFRVTAPAHLLMENIVTKVDFMKINLSKCYWVLLV